MNKITFLGAAGMVTGSNYLLSSHNSQPIMIDFGMFQGPENISNLNYAPLEYNPRDVQHVLLTHAHLDHSGRLPLLIKHGFSGKVFMTQPTADLIAIALHDSAHIAEHDEDVKAMYTSEDVDLLLRRIEIVDYDQEISVGPYTAIYRDAGHILGSACIEIHPNGTMDNASRIVFSGDLGNMPHELLRTTHVFDSAETVIMESTYGGRNHPTQDPATIIQSNINHVEQNGGVVLIPAFSIERSQELLYIIRKLKLGGAIKMETPIYLDSPMAIRTTEVYTDYPMLFNDALQKDMKAAAPFIFPGLHETLKPHQSDGIYKTKGPKVIIAGSGMMTGGRILKHAQNFISKSSTRLIIVGYQGEETLGRKILEGAQEIELREVMVPVRAHIETINSMSAHADEKQLIDWFEKIHDVKNLILTHGDDEPREILKSKIGQSHSSLNIHMPKLNESLDLID